MTESLQRKSWKVLSTLVRLSGVVKEEILVSGCQEENDLTRILETVPSGALDGQEITQGPAQAPDPVPVGALGTADDPQSSWCSIPAQVTAQTPMERANRARPFEA